MILSEGADRASNFTDRFQRRAIALYRSCEGHKLRNVFAALEWHEFD